MRPCRWRTEPRDRAAIVAGSYLAGSLPWSQLAARRRGVDLRRFGTGTVSGTALYRVAGFAPLAIAGSLDVAKGAVGPLIATPRRPGLAAAAAAAAVAGHNWSPFLGFAGGRGVAPALGGLLAGAPAGAAVLLGGLVAGRLRKQTGLGCFAAYVALGSSRASPARDARRGARRGRGGAAAREANLWAIVRRRRGIGVRSSPE